ncbi:predicted protein [Nematostella vectensis]|uniref:VWFA domain-containing protein n=1 Tax=Nematostella vectensis TaxID=45351 RepID=A7RKE4_NEMVE|nr:predicted protein [Nematostella vectensis]|eukprot:XP_001640219.1 predicted protein [Nematostella vectensis]
MFIITAGPPEGDTDVANIALLRKKFGAKGVEIFGLGIEPDSPAYPEVSKVVSSPVADHAFRLHSSHEMKSLYRKLRGRGAYSWTCAKRKVRVTHDECKRRCQCHAGRVTNCTRVRKDFIWMPLGDRRRFIAAFKKLTKDKRYKKEYDTIVRVHREHRTMIHSARYFLPWHRQFLLNLENQMRKIDCRLTIPYWDWTLTSNNPWNDGEFGLWSPQDYGIGGNGRGLHMHVLDGPFREGSWTFGKGGKVLTRNFSGVLPNKVTVQRALQLPHKRFTDFETQLRIFHHFVRCAIGGTACSLDSARSPEFLLITAYIDKLWGDWQARKADHWPVGFPVVSDLLPGYKTYTGEVLELRSLPGVVKVAYERSDRKP